MSDSVSRLRDIAEEYLYLDAPLKELKSKLLYEIADELELANQTADNYMRQANEFCAEIETLKEYIRKRGK